MLIFIRASFLHDEEGELPAEPEDDVPDAVHHAASHLDDGDDGDVGVDGDSDDHAAGHLR